MTGTLPTAISQLTRLTHLALSSNAFVGTIPTELGLLTNLNVLAMSGNKLTGFVPSEIGELSHLGIAEFHYHPLSPPVPPKACALGIEILMSFKKETYEGEGFNSGSNVVYSDGCT